MKDARSIMTAKNFLGRIAELSMDTCSTAFDLGSIYKNWKMRCVLFEPQINKLKMIMMIMRIKLNL